MPNGQPAQLANLRPWRRGAAPKGGRRSRDIDKAIALVRKHSPEAVRFVARVLHDETVDMRTRLKAAEIFIEHSLPKNPEALAQIAVGGAGIEWLQLRFVRPGQPAAAPETHRITFDPATDVEGNETG